MGSIRKKDSTGRWEARYRDPNGRPRSRSFDRRAEAKAFLSAIEADMRRGSWQDPASAARRLEEVAQEWLESNPGKRPTTYVRDAASIRVHLLPVLGNLRIGQVRPSDVQATIERMRARGLGSRAIRTNYGVLRAILNWAVNTDIIDRSPCRGIRLPELTAVKKPVVSADDVLRLADAIDPYYRVAVFLGAMGLRQAEVFGLRVGSINFLRRTITVEATINEVEGQIVEGRGKTPNSNRTFSAPQEVLDELAAHLRRTGRTSPEDLVLQAPGGGPVRATNFRYRVYTPALEATGLAGLTFHRLRHSAGHMMREVGVPLEVIQRRLGHASIRTTADIYGTLPENVDRAAADQLDGLFKASRNDRKSGPAGAAGSPAPPA
jgi:integrase